MQSSRPLIPRFWLKMIAIVLACLMVVLLAIWLWLQSDARVKQDNPSSDMSQAQSVAMTVEAIYPTVQILSDDVVASGNVVGQNIAEVGAKVNGVAIAQVLVDVGDVVQQGQVLAYLDNRQASANVLAATADVEQAWINLTKASNDLQRVEPLIQIDAISREQYENYQANKLNAEANFKAAQARLANSQISEGDASVVAPVSGIISQNLAKVGMMANGTTLFSIIENGQLQWQASVPVAKIHQIGIGQPVQIQTNNPNQVANAVVTQIAPVANNSREITVYATIVEPASLRAGMYQLGVFIGPQQPAITLPVSVVTSSDGYDYVWVLSKNKHNASNAKHARLAQDVFYAYRQKIQVIRRHDEFVAVDLPQDILLIQSGGNFLNDGDLVKVANFERLSQKAAQASQIAMSVMKP